MHLYTRLRERGDVALQVVPGIPGMVGCWHATGQPITWGDDVLSVMTGTLSEDEMVRRMDTAEALVVMKVGRNLPRIRRALARAGRLEAAWLVQNGSTASEQVARLTEVSDEACPYFAIVLVHGQGRRPEAAW
jgi:precorrin-2/cobalt-factor-2 C20-methyltransferase